MAYVAPHGTIELYTGVNIDPNYKNTMYFENESAQRTYFSSKLMTGGTFTNQMYTRVSMNKVRVHTKADNVYGCTYLGFQNESKWFYGFVIDVRYINEQVTEVVYRIDEIQTWLFQIVWHNCFIERQHSKTDTRGDNLQPEPISVDEHIAIESSGSFLSSNGVAYILSVGTVNTTQLGDLSAKNKFNGIGSTVKYLYFNSPSSIVSFLNACEFENGMIKGLVGSLDVWAPLTLYAVPSGCFDVSGGSTVGTLVGNVTVLPENITTTKKTVDYPTEHGFGGSYEPVNKKLLTYPYTYLKIETPVKSQDYKYETFYRPSSGKPRFVMYATCNPTPTFVIVPEQYNGLSNDFSYALTLEDFPQLQIYSSGLWGAAGGGIATILKMAIGGLIGGVGGLISGANAASQYNPSYGENMLNSGMQDIVQPSEAIKSSVLNAASEVPDIRVIQSIRGSGGATSIAPMLAYVGTGGSQATEQAFDIMGVQYGLREEFARKIDLFFSKYGYAQNCVAFPDIHARTKWTYVKTKDCYIGGPIPSSSKEVICNAMNSGITWWTGASVVGIYVNASTGKPLENPIV